MSFCSRSEASEMVILDVNHLETSTPAHNVQGESWRSKYVIQQLEVLRT